MTEYVVTVREVGAVGTTEETVEAASVSLPESNEEPFVVFKDRQGGYVRILRTHRVHDISVEHG